MPSDALETFASQWLERSLDDNAIRRMNIPEMFLLTDAILILLDNVTNGIVVFEGMVRRRLEEHLPFMAIETIIMKLVAKGYSRQDVHEKTRVLSHEVAYEMKMNGRDNDMIARIKADKYFVGSSTWEQHGNTDMIKEPIWSELDTILDARAFTGRAAELTERYIGPDGPLAGQLAKYRKHIDSAKTATLHV